MVGDTGIELKYTVKLKVIPPCFALEDDYEDNDTFSTARSLKPDPDQQVRICKGEEDWYTIDVVPGDDLFIDVTAGFDDETQSEPMLDVALFDETGEVPVSEVETLRTPGGALYGVQLRDITEPRRLALRVQGEGGEQQGPYTISKYQYRPCGEQGGDDRFEDNDAPQAPKDLPRGQGPTRHLRLCPGDADFHKLAVQKDDQIVLGIKHDELESDAELDAAPVIFNLWNEGADTIVAEGARVEAAPPEEAPVQMAVSSEKHEEEDPINYVLEVRSPSTEARYYDLIPLDGDAAQPPEQEPQDGEQSEDGEEGEEGEEQEGEQPQPEDGEEEQEEQEPQPSEEEPDEERLQEIEEILENLEESDDNFQLRKALKNVPDRYIENDW